MRSRPGYRTDRHLICNPNTPRSEKRGSASDPAGGAHSAPADPLARFKPILCLVVFFIGPNCMRILLSPHF